VSVVVAIWLVLFAFARGDDTDGSSYNNIIFVVDQVVEILRMWLSVPFYISLDENSKSMISDNGDDCR
jgi:hypothetical protein